MNHEHHESHDHHDHNDHARMFRDKFWLSLVLAIPVLAYSETIQSWFNFTTPVFPGSHLIPFVFSTILFSYGGWVFVTSAKDELRSRKPGMMTLITLAISVAYIYSVATQFFIEGESFFWELATLIVIMLLGHWLEMAAVTKAGGALDDIVKLLPDEAEVFKKGGKIEAVKVDQLKKGDIVIVRPGARLPVDGEVIEGESSVDESVITGESLSVLRVVGDKVIAGTLNQDGVLKVLVSETSESTVVAGIQKLVKEAEASKSRAQMLADKAAFWLTIVAVSAAIITFTVWLYIGGLSVAVERMVTVLIIACPHALGLAIPLVVSISSTLAARNGILIRKRLAFESARNIDQVLFDKTGTLTEGVMQVENVISNAGYRKSEILSLAASLEQFSEHAIGRAIISQAKKFRTSILDVKDFKNIPGFGVSAKLKSGENIMVVSRFFVDKENIKLDKKLEESRNLDATEAYILKDREIVGLINLTDKVRKESEGAIKKLQDFGIKAAMITGDAEGVAKKVSKKLGLDNYLAEVQPSGKVNQVKLLQKTGQKVMMVGDGVNDAPALMQANIGVAIGAGTDIAIKSADVVLVEDNPEGVVKMINLSRAAYKKMVQNLMWATGYNIVAIPLSAGVLAGFGVIISPAVGAAIMSLSTIIVALNAQTLWRTKL